MGGIHFFFFGSCLNYLDELARKRLLRKVRAELNDNWGIRKEEWQKYEFRRRARVELHFRVSSIKSVVTETKSWSQIPRKYSFQNLWI